MATYIRNLADTLADAILSTAQHPAFRTVSLATSSSNRPPMAPAQPAEHAAAVPDAVSTAQEPPPAIESPETTAWRDNYNDSDEDVNNEAASTDIHHTGVPVPNRRIRHSMRWRGGRTRRIGGGRPGVDRETGKRGGEGRFLCAAEHEHGHGHEQCPRP